MPQSLVQHHGTPGRRRRDHLGQVVIHAVEPSDGFRQRLQQNLSTRGRAAAERPPNLRVEVCEGDAQSLQSFGAKRMVAWCGC